MTTTGSPTATFTESMQRDFEEHGFVRVGKVADDHELAALRDRIDAIMLGQVRYDGMMMQLDPSTRERVDQTREFKGASLDYRKIQDLDLDSLFRAFMEKRVFRDLTRRLIGENVAIFRAMFMNKPAGGGSELRWHQDGIDYADASSPWGLTKAPKVTVWTALDAATVPNGCVQLIPGTHKEVIGAGPSDEEVGPHLARSEPIFLEVDAGEAVLLHNWTLHRSDVNHTDRPRRAFSVCYIDAASRQLGTEKAFPTIFPQYRPVADRPAV